MRVYAICLLITISYIQFTNSECANHTEVISAADENDHLHHRSSLDDICQDGLRIVGGTPANITEAPYQVSIRQLKSPLFSAWRTSITCGGSLILPKVVLTAAHCFGTRFRSVSADLYVIILGSTFRVRRSPQAQLRMATRIAMHPEFQMEPLVRNDVAVMILNRAAVETDYVRMVLMAKGPIAENTQCLVTGWGRQDFYISTKPPCLMKAIVPLLDVHECRKRSMIPIGEGVICAGYFEGGIDSCTGDSGGPLVCDGVQYGIVSYGKGCAERDHPGLYTDVTEHLDWIRAEALTDAGVTLKAVALLLISLALIIIMT